jgi:hypothetical protein
MAAVHLVAVATGAQWKKNKKPAAAGMSCDNSKERELLVVSSVYTGDRNVNCSF